VTANYKNHDVETNTSHAEKLKKFSEDSERNFERGAKITDYARAACGLQYKMDYFLFFYF